MKHVSVERLRVAKLGGIEHPSRSEIKGQRDLRCTKPLRDFVTPGTATSMRCNICNACLRAQDLAPEPKNTDLALDLWFDVSHTPQVSAALHA